MRPRSFWLHKLFAQRFAPDFCPCFFCFFFEWTFLGMQHRWCTHLGIARWKPKHLYGQGRASLLNGVLLMGSWLINRGVMGCRNKWRKIIGFDWGLWHPQKWTYDRGPSCEDLSTLRMPYPPPKQYTIEYTSYIYIYMYTYTSCTVCLWYFMMKYMIDKIVYVYYL